jgi:amino acid adenylation domain-containing protein
VSEPAKAMRGLSREKLDLLIRRLGEKKKEEAAGEGAAGIPRRSDPAAAALLSSAQERLWFVEQLAPGSAAYNVPGPVRLRGRLAIPALARSLAEVVRRHDALRTTFEGDGEEARQVVGPAGPRRLPVLDLTALPAGSREAEALRQVRVDARRPFSLRRGPLFRFGLVRLAAEDHVLLATFHHVVSDGWSLGVLVRELSALYPAYLRGEPSPLPQLPIQYPDFAAWQRRWLGGEEPAEHLEAWRRLLDGAPQTLDLPSDRPRPAVQTFRGGFLRQSLDADVTRRLGELARASGGTLFMALLAAFGVLLSRWSGQRDLVVGSPVANRVRVETEALIGFFVNALPLRLDLRGVESFRQLLARCREMATEAFAHQDLPFERLVEALAVSRDLSRPPLFQVIFALQNAGPARIELPDLTIEGVKLHTGSAKFDLSLVLEETGGGLRGGWEYDRDLFDETTVRRLAAAFRRALSELAAAPDRSLAAIDLLGPGQRQQVLVEWADTADRAAASGPAAHLAVVAAARERPDAVAAVDEAGEAGATGRPRCVSYRELMRRSEALAHRLRAQGVGAETVVAVCLERSIDLVVAELAVLLAGGAYLPVDPAYPPQRRRFMVEDAGAAVVLTREGIAGEPGGAPGAPGLRPDDPAPAAGLAYVIYTSGSTGRPKGTLLSHRGLANLVAWHRRTYRLAPGDVAPLVAGPGFDASVWETWPALAAGATLAIPAPDTVALAERLAAWLASRRVTVGFLPTPLAEAVLDHAQALAGAPLRALLTGGDRLRRRSPAGAGFEVVNHYGPTESTVVTTRSVVASTGSSAPPIGRPIANLAVRLLDRELRPVPPGVAGELHVSGVGLARGYLARPALSAERFVPDPFATVEGGRLYRTGDLARWLPDGEVEFLGRIDHQVKVRGFRIELGEIEALLAERPEVASAVVMARQAGAAGARLVAYVVPRRTAADPGRDDAELVGELRAAIGERLPDYMVPSAFVVLDELPLTANGKVDRQALPEPRGEGAGGAAGEPPRGPTEELLAGLWSELLGVEAVGRDADFFALGGHSLLAARLISRVRGALGVELALRAFFQAPTIAALGAEVEARRRDGAPAPPPLERRPPEQRTEAPLSFAQERLWFLDRLEPGTAHYNVPCAVRLSGRLDLPRLASSMRRIVRRHEALRTAFVSRAEGPRQVVLEGVRLPVPVIDLSALGTRSAQGAARAVGRLARAEAERGFDLSEGAPVRASVVRMAPREHVLLLTLHHIVADAWSAGVLVRELAAFYRPGAESAGLPELPIQYPDFALWQRRWLAGGEIERQLAYWRRQLAGAPEVLALPTDRPRPAVATPQGRRLPVRLAPDLADAVRRLARSRGATPFMVLLAAFDVLLLRHAGEDDLVVGTPVANRNRAELEGLIGFFVNTLVLRVGVAGRPRFSELVDRVRAVTLDAYGHQDVPFEKLVAELQPRRSRSHSPLFQVMFSLQAGDLVPTLELPELEIAPVPLSAETTKFDLTLALREAADGGLSGLLGFRTTLLDATTVERLLGHFRNLVAAACREPETGIDRLPWLAPGERHQVVTEWPRPPAARARYECVTEALREVAQAAPDRVALVIDERSVSYGELARRARCLARALRARGAGPDRVVALSVERGPATAVAILGVLEAGAAYLPMDPALPPERRAFMMEDAGAHVLVTGRGLAQGLPEPPGGVLFLEDLEAGAAREEGAEEPAGPDPANLAYVIYTSGSTGRPKGVMISHRSLARRVAGMAETFALDESDRQLQLVSLSFDVLGEELYVPLVSGGAVVFHHAPASLAGGEMMDHVERHRVTKANVMASLWNHLAQELAASGRRLPASLRVLTTGAESPAVEALEAWSRLAPEGHRFFNVYGPTEGTILVSAERRVFPRDAGSAETRIPMGRSVAEAPVYGVDPDLRPVAAGVVGELVIGGPGVGRGYLGRAAGTAERFVPDPFAAAPGRRLYRTGDLARRRADGRLEFLRRIDAQVKVRGFRIELGEVEGALREHPGLRDVAVAARPAESGQLRLVAYVVPEPGAGLTIAEIRESLSGRLPDYMVPGVYVTLDALPITQNGKLDRRALPEPGRERSELAAAYREPGSALERHLADLWQEVLGIDRVGLADGFFDLGGDSIQGATLIKRLEDELGEYVYVTALFDTSNLGELAAYLAQHYARAVAARFGDASLPEQVRLRRAEGERRLGAADVETLRGLIPPLAPAPHPARAPNPRAVFVLSPPRSGSTLLRVVLGGHPRLFAPPELELLSFNTLGERREALAGRYAFWLEGVLRAVMEVRGCDAEEARALMAEREARDQSVRDFYGELQEWIGDRVLVEKTPSYTLDRTILERAEADFDEPLFVHLMRHPYGTILSFEEARIDQLFFRHEHPYGRRELAELVWTICHENVLSFLETVPQERRHRVRFEDLTARPEETARELCRFLGTEFEPAMVDPYRDQSRRMTDGIHPLAKMLGDVKFHEHRAIDAQVAERWREAYDHDFLGEPARELAARLGYADLAPPKWAAPAPRRGASAGSEHLVALRPGTGAAAAAPAPLFLVHGVLGDVHFLRHLAAELTPGRPVWGLRAAGADPGTEPVASIDEMAERYLAAVRQVQGHGPYRLAGSSMGAVVAHEMARVLRAAGEEVALLAYLDPPEPEEPPDRLEGRDLELGVLEYLLGHRDPEAESRLRELEPRDERLRWILRRAQGAGALPAGFDLARLERTVALVEVHARALSAHRSRVFDGRALLLRAEETAARATVPEVSGWAGLCAGGVDVVIVPGAHMSLHFPPHVSTVAQVLEERLEAAANPGAVRIG